MISRHRARYGTILLLALLGVVGPRPCRADMIVYNVTADTSSVLGQAGTVDIAFNPAGLGGSDTAVLQSLSGGTPGAVNIPPTGGDVTGSLSSLPVTFTDDQATNELNQAFTFAGQLQFSLKLTSNSSSPGATFSFSMFDQNGNPINPGPNGFSAVAIDVAAGGQQASPQYGPNTGAPHAAPEPSSAVLLGLGSAGLAAGLIWRRRSRAARLRAA
jgi:hypothetical protein